MNNNEPVVVERVLHAKPSIVWKALTDNATMKKWYFDMPAFEPTAGFEFQFIGGTPEKQFLHLCKVMEGVPEKKLVHSWRYDGYPGNSTVTFELFAEGDTTLLRVTHEGLGTLAEGGPDFARENFVTGWNAIVGTNLPKFLETGN